MNAVDTNVLIYVLDPREPVKQQEAVRLWHECVFSISEGSGFGTDQLKRFRLNGL